MTDTIRLYEHGRFSNIPVPEWFDRAVDISRRENFGWPQAVSRVLGAEHQGLTVEPAGPIGLDISFWHLPREGVYVEVDSSLDMIEQVLVRDTADWLPFMTTHLMPLVTAAAQMETAHQLERLANTALSWVRYGSGQHVDRSSGFSQVDRQRDREAVARLREQS